MRILQNQNQIPWNDPRRRESIDGPNQTHWNPRLACTNHCQKHLIIPRIWQLLPKIHPELLQYRSTNE